ncbi:hypothetical protein GPUN_1364 [Glaciecola punicea ACAM 611]|uniref:Uncharacterized protein n=1 Tax=Glaciecola punicea ACAM 611 TaxID=1121923 RepID=H5TB11_9ALTE|nr:hypothetical protein GPUN_1364 [Glaciecola punicea ACAM 611]
MNIILLQGQNNLQGLRRTPTFNSIKKLTGHTNKRSRG